MGHPKDIIQFGIPLASADGKYRSKYPLGDWPGVPGSASGAGAGAIVSPAVGLGVGGASATGAGTTDTAAAPTGVASVAATASGSGRTATASAPSGNASATATAGLIFEDDFSTGNLTKATDKFRWGDRTGFLGPNAGQAVVSVTGPLGTMINALRFSYGTFQEVRFALTSSLSEINPNGEGSSNVAYPELWTRFDLFIPVNYFHGNTGDGSLNNKWFVVYKDGYLTANSGVANFFELLPNGDGSSICSMTDNAQGGLRRDTSFITVPALRQGTNNQVFAVRTSEAGTWINFCFRCRVPTGPSTNDGLMHVWKNGSLAWGWDNIIYYDPTNNPAKAGFDRGYLMGYHNSVVPAGPQVWYLANFKIGTNAASVGL